MISGGYLDRHQRTSSVLLYETNNINNGHVEVASMKHARYYHACTIFKSPLHDGRPVAIVAGGYGSPKTAEILDFTQDGSTWQESKLIFALVQFLLFVPFTDRAMSTT